MSERESYPHGVPCWVDALVPDPEAARRFYGGVFGWEFEGPVPMAGNPDGAYYLARVRGRDVAGVGSLPPGMPGAGHMTHVRVESAGEAARAAEKAGGHVLAPPFDVPPVGRMAVLQDPGGGQFAAWEAAGRDGAQLVNEPGAWSMSALHVADPDAVIPFYAELFGWHAEPAGPGAWLLRLPGYVGGEPEQPVPRDVVALIEQDPEAARGFWRTDFWIADLDAAARAIPELGGRVIDPPAPIPGLPFKAALVADPAGATFSLSQLLLERAETRAAA
ncbi:MAG TPA: VOC family protein [Solirubrobacterales bacterium]